LRERKKVFLRSPSERVSLKKTFLRERKREIEQASERARERTV